MPPDGPGEVKPPPAWAERVDGAGVPRRTFLWTAAASAGAFAAGCKGEAAPPASQGASGAGAAKPTATEGARKVAPPSAKAARLLPAEERALGAMLGRLLPDDAVEGLPGAGEAGVAGYLRRELGKAQFRGIGREIRRGLQRLDAVSRREGGGQPFAARAAKDQDDLMRRFQTGKVEAGRFDTRRFFELVFTLALEGYLGDPAYGGNRDGRVWAALGVGGQCGGTPGFTGGAQGAHSLGGHGPHPKHGPSAGRRP